MTGAGKTTLADIVLGLLHPQKGMVKIDGVDIAEERSKMVGFVPQNVNLLDDTMIGERGIRFSGGQR